MPNKTHGKVEGEGSYKGTRQYNAHLKEWVEKGNIDEAADRARKAVEENDAELREAEAKGKSGPQKASAKKSDSAPKMPHGKTAGTRSKRSSH